MTGTVTCPRCNRSLPAADDDLALSVACPSCRKPVAVTGSSFQPHGRPTLAAPAAIPWTAVHEDDLLPWPAHVVTTPAQPAPAAPWAWSRKRFVAAVSAGVVASLAAGLLTGWANRLARPTPRIEVAAVTPRFEVPVVVPTPTPVPVVPVAVVTRVADPEPKPTPTAIPAPEVPVDLPAAPLVVVPVAPVVAPVPADPQPLPMPPAPKTDARGFTIHTVAKRIDTRKADELQKEMLAAREVSLDAPGTTKVTTDLVQFARAQRAKGLAYPGTVTALKSRPELAGLPFQTGAEATLGKEPAEAMSALSKQLRETIQTCIRPGIDPRPDPDDLHAALKGGFGNRKVWATAEAVPCVVQMLQPENREIRRMSCELLRGLDVPEATEALVKWAVFDVDAGNRAAAIAALKERDRAEVARLLTPYVRYPWARAAEHACEALVALDCKEAIPQLAAAFDRPDPDAPFRVHLPGGVGGTFRLEVVRVNHVRNCVTCHAPSFQATDLVRGAVPDVTLPLPPATTPAYYNRPSAVFVTASVTYLRQDFSLAQPVANPGKWPEYQRFDYFVAVRREAAAPAAKPAADSPYRRAVGFALRELSGRDPEVEPDWLAEQREAAGPSDDGAVARVARFASLNANPTAMAAVGFQGFERSLLGMPDAELVKTVNGLIARYGGTAIRLAVVVHLDLHTRSADPQTRAKAGRMTAAALGKASDSDLPTALRDAARGPKP